MLNCPKDFIFINSLNLDKHSLKSVLLFPFAYSDKKTEAQRGPVICLKLSSHQVKPRFKLRQCGSRTHPLNQESLMPNWTSGKCLSRKLNLKVKISSLNEVERTRIKLGSPKHFLLTPCQTLKIPTVIFYFLLWKSIPLCNAHAFKMKVSLPYNNLYTLSF